jgi:putative transposase
MVRTEAERAASQTRKQAKKTQKVASKKKHGRPKGSRNKNKAAVELNPELQCIQKMLQSFLGTIQGVLHLTYLLRDGHFGNYPVFYMVR